MDKTISFTRPEKVQQKRQGNCMGIVKQKITNEGMKDHHVLRDPSNHMRDRVGINIGQEVSWDQER